jgi:hypothetical protein
MKDEKNTALVDAASAQSDERWLEDVDADLPGEIAEAKGHGKLPPKVEKLKIALTVQELPDGKHKQFKAALTDTLREVFERGAQELGKPLLPPNAMPLDTLHYRVRGEDLLQEIF